ncbi:hypothetical protein DEO72_LG10g2459 [Vigna unguiculata]|uniref:Uncharacterized protein n=1 Tax=Vigna unguiculata TaxID=3917 RepID=A0A4D6NBZ7_VIGUN|nr:hypothetical protein DEO72_LG10g2458 [Vigna unguiculata]QCE11226.1 hypothetical protein DEO72_LG10g2459 [Vigna unguiculata]
MSQRNNDDGWSKKKKMQWRWKPPRRCSGGAGGMKGWRVVEEWIRCVGRSEKKKKCRTFATAV